MERQLIIKLPDGFEFPKQFDFQFLEPEVKPYWTYGCAYCPMLQDDYENTWCMITGDDAKTKDKHVCPFYESEKAEINLCEKE